MSTGTVTTALMSHTAKAGTEREEVTGGWGNLRSEKFRNFYAPPSIITVIECRRLIWEEQKFRRGEIHTKFQLESQKEI